jgi:hypothetical protein
MIREHLNRALVLAAGLSMAAAAAAQAPAAATNAAAPTTKVDDKAKPDKAHDKKADDKKADDKKADDKAPSDTAAAAKDGDRAAIVKAQHDAERAKIAAVLHGPMNEAMREELKRHARRMARLERIKALASEAKDNDAVTRATKLIDKENVRHDKWIAQSAMAAQANPNPVTK